MVSTPRNADLYKALRLLSEKVLHLLKNVPLNERGASRLSPVIKTTEHSTTIEQRERPNWPFLVDRHWDCIRGTEEFKKALQVLLALERVHDYARRMYHRGDGLPLTQEDMSRFFEDQIIRIFLWNFVEISASFIPANDRFDAIYPYWEELLLTDFRALRSFSILEAFRGPQEPIELDAGVMIRRASDADLSEIADTWRDFLEPHNLGRRCWLLEIEYKVTREEGINIDIERVNRVLTALRLTKKGGVYARYVFAHSKGDISRRSCLQLPAPQSASRYELTSPDDIARLRDIWALYKVRPIHPTIDFAIRRFNFGYERWRAEDRITDHVIGLEMLYVPDSQAGEIGYKLQMRAAALLGKDMPLEERATIKNNSQGAYRIRSLLVHGVPDHRKLRNALGKLGLLTPDELSALVEGYLRDSLLHFLRNPRLLNPESLDNMVLALSTEQN